MHEGKRETEGKKEHIKFHLLSFTQSYVSFITFKLKNSDVVTHSI